MIRTLSNSIVGTADIAGAEYLGVIKFNWYICLPATVC
jgi:hypothetical protein